MKREDEEAVTMILTTMAMFLTPMGVGILGYSKAVPLIMGLECWVVLTFSLYRKR